MTAEQLRPETNTVFTRIGKR